MLDFVSLFAIGIFGGFLAGFLGIGGGILYIAVLPIFLARIGVEGQELVQFTIANSIFGTLAAGVAGNIAHLQGNRFYKKEVILVSLSGVISAVLALLLIVNTNWYSGHLFNLLVVLLLSYILYKTLKNSAKKFKFIREVTFDPGKLSIAGTIGGTIAACSGLGGGAIIVPLLNIGLKMNIKKAKSISLGVILVTSAAITLVNLISEPTYNGAAENVGFIVPSIVGPMSLGVLISTPLGVKIGKSTPAFLISYVFSVFLALVILKKSVELYHFIS